MKNSVKSSIIVPLNQPNRGTGESPNAHPWVAYVDWRRRNAAPWVASRAGTLR